MTPVRHITIHHDGMPPVSLNSRAQIAARIEVIRAGHRAKGWGDIGYHFIVDPQGAVWQGRALLWQGAHVKDRNEGNVGVLVLGNFDSTRPTAAQHPAGGTSRLGVRTPLGRVHLRCVVGHTRRAPTTSTSATDGRLSWT